IGERGAKTPSMSLHRILGLLLRYLLLYRQSWTRVMEIFFWPVMDLLVWGFLTTYLLKAGNSSVPALVTFLIGAMIFWDLLYRAQQGVTLSFLEDVWARNLLNIFVAPVTIGEFLAATLVLGFLKVLVNGLVLAALAWLFYAFDIFQLGFSLIPFVLSLLLMGWAMGMVTVALIMRLGHAAEALAWAIPFFVQPLSAVFYPVSVLPAWLQWFAWVFPSTYVFEGMRETLRTGQAPWSLLWWSLALNVIYLAAAAWVFRRLFATVRVKGLLGKLGME
ncbi:MAG: ABC transporter permease, partial [Verrucomicrobiae bacterium]|nr:ABC transporter permease [Verrucomicrobiae bacterium]